MITLLFYFYNACFNCFLLKTNDACHYGYTFVAYANRPATLLSIICEVGATFDRYRTSTNKFKIFDKISFWIKITLMIVFTLIYYLYWVFAFRCTLSSVERINATNESMEMDSYSFEYNDFGKSISFKSLNLVSRMIRDLAFGCILIILNVLTLIFMRQVFIKKRQLKATSTHANVLLETTRDEKAERKITFMVITTSLVVIVGHIPRFVYSFEVSIGVADTKCISAISNVLLDLSYAVSFFFYLIFLSDFRMFFKNISLKIVNILTLKFRE